MNITYICKDILRVCLSFITFITCGIKETVVKNAARYPIISIIVILLTMNIKKIKIKKLALILTLFFLIIDISLSYYYFNYCENFVNERKCSGANAAVVFFAGFDKKFNLDTLQKSRLNKAIELYKHGIVKKIICVGGNRPNQQLFGSRQSSKYLKSKSIPSHAINFDTLSFDTRTNLREAHNIIRKNNLQKIIYVSDVIHLHRISIFSNYPNYCLNDIDYSFNFIQLIRMTNQSFVSFLLENILSEKDYINLIYYLRD